MTGSPESTLTPREAELRRRLAELAATATVDDVWEQIQDRIAAGEPGRPQGRGRAARRVAVAVAAVVLLVVGVAVLGGRDDGRERLDTVDDTTSTTVDRDGGSGTTTTAPGPGDQPGDDDQAGSTGDGTGTGVGDGPGSGDGTDEGADTGGTDPGGGGATSPGATTPDDPGSPSPSVTRPSLNPDPDAAPDGRVPVVEFGFNSETGVRVTAWRDGAGFHMTLWQYNPWRELTTWSWSNVPGQNCFAGSLGTFQIPELAPFSTRRLAWGFVRADAGTVGVIDGPTDFYDSMPRYMGPEVFAGLRPWITDVQGSDPVQRFRAIATDNSTLHYADPPTWDARPATC